MQVDNVMDLVSNSLSRLSVEAKVNAYNLLAIQNNKSTYSVSFNETLQSASDTGFRNILKSGDAVSLVKEKKEIDEIILNALEISSEHGRLISVLNSRIALEKMSIKGR
ncbi:hypothetical protein K6Y31_20275 [Motilimonas cestriensis]|uniref:Uncharacterized protein n=1 Tax=Motilimonas cestriensis TaxID=2742685 RepID=A0ABS8WDI7_9GAMM|nr:hypothetical protein [Motilimonas cestriensis]MCE2597114.1 hypothetical protein [Motilimonas cestriensis]